MMRAQFALDFPDPILSPNAHVSWRAKDTARKVAKLRGKNQAINAGTQPTAAHLQAHLIFYPPDERRRDLDNLLASMKPSLDGICEGIGIDDRQIKRITVEWGERIENGFVIVELSTL